MASDNQAAGTNAVEHGNSSPRPSAYPVETQITRGPGGRILTNIGVWSPDSRRIVYDTRSDADGTRFDGERIEVVEVATGAVETVYMAKNGAFCGVATFHPTDDRVVFILGPEFPTADWSYGPAHRQGVMVDLARPEAAINLDARDLTPPFTPGALRGGSHVHVFSPDGQWVSFTYNDAVLSEVQSGSPEQDIDQRNVGVSVFEARLPVPEPRRLDSLSRSHGGTAFSVLVTRTVANPAPGSDEIQRAFEEGWVGTNGYCRPDGTRQKRALAFLGEVISPEGNPLIEVFVADLPDDVTARGEWGPLEGTETRRPAPPHGTRQRRLTFTADHAFPGVQGPRHWVRSAPDGSQIAFLMRDTSGTPQLWTVSPNGGEPNQIARDSWGIASAFSWSPDGTQIAYIADNSVFVVTVQTGQSVRLTARSTDADAPLSLACVFSPDGRRIAYGRRLPEQDRVNGPRHNQICVVTLPETGEF
ncbi:MAG: DUF3748 domain-containing protein [Armatimonadota bacterium]